MERKQGARKREKKEKQDMDSFFATETFADSEDDQNNDNLYNDKRIHRRAKTGCVINIPYDILKNKNLNALIVRLDITPAQTSALLQLLITECGGDPSQVDLSYSSARRFREEKVHEIATDIKMNIKLNYPLGLHWDGKIMSDNEDNITKIERLPVLVSDSEGTEQLLGVAKLPVGVEPGTAGKHIAEAAVNYVKQWNLLELIATMHFDTTNTNTGKESGACIQLQNIIGRPLLWVACRKHIGEIHVGKAFDILKVEVNASPDVLVFKRFREDFNKIALGTAPKKLFDINSLKPEHQKFFIKKI